MQKASTDLTNTKTVIEGLQASLEEKNKEISNLKEDLGMKEAEQQSEDSKLQECKDLIEGLQSSLREKDDKLKELMKAESLLCSSLITGCV